MTFTHKHQLGFLHDALDVAKNAERDVRRQVQQEDIGGVGLQPLHQFRYSGV